MSSPNKIIVFIDYDNIKMNMKTEPPEKLSEQLGYERFKAWLCEHGEIAAIFIFAPAVTIHANIDFFYRLDFIPIACAMLPQEPRRKSFLDEETEEELPPINKTDEILIRTASLICNIAPDITHICIASADADFIPIAKLAKHMGKKVMITFSDYRPSRDLLSFADVSEHGKSMMHMFNPIRD